MVNVFIVIRCWLRLLLVLISINLLFCLVFFILWKKKVKENNYGSINWIIRNYNKFDSILGLNCRYLVCFGL